MIAPSFLLLLVNLFLTFFGSIFTGVDTPHYDPQPLVTASARLSAVMPSKRHSLRVRKKHPEVEAVAEVKPEPPVAESRDFIEAPNLDPKVLSMALHAVQNADKMGVQHKNVLAIIDYSLASNQKRMWILDLKNKRVDLHTLVAHGKGSGMDNATKFSNAGGSKASSLGLFVTGTTYFGHNGLSLRLLGLERGINDNAFRRAVVMHGAAYVSNGFVKSHGRTGRSWGCPAVPAALSHDVITKLKNGALVFAYFPDRHWIKHSRYLA